MSVDLSTADGPAELVASALADGPLDVLVNNVGAVTPRLDGFLVGHRRRVAAVAHARLHGRGAHDSRRAAADARARARARSSTSARSTRSCRIRPSSTTAPRRPRWPTSPRRCRRRSARAASASTRSARARSRPSSGSATTASPPRSPRRRAATRGDDRRAAGRAGRDRPLHHARRRSPISCVLLAGDRAGNVTGVRLRDRRRPRPDALTPFVRPLRSPLPAPARRRRGPHRKGSRCHRPRSGGAR